MLFVLILGIICTRTTKCSWTIIWAISIFVIHILSKLDRTLKKKTVSSSITIQSLATMYTAAMYTCKI